MAPGSEVFPYGNTAGNGQIPAENGILLHDDTAFVPTDLNTTGITGEAGSGTLYSAYGSVGKLDYGGSGILHFHRPGLCSC